jgi:hypothetical protein
MPRESHPPAVALLTRAEAPITLTLFDFATVNTGESTHILPWFARQVPSSSVNGWYTFLNTYTGPAAVCR